MKLTTHSLRNQVYSFVQLYQFNCVNYRVLFLALFSSVIRCFQPLVTVREFRLIWRFHIVSLWISILQIRSAQVKSTLLTALWKRSLRRQLFPFTNIKIIFLFNNLHVTCTVLHLDRKSVEFSYRIWGNNFLVTVGPFLLFVVS
jgi:hypothetical protein